MPPLRKSDPHRNPTSPEALAITAFVNSGTFDPWRYGISGDDLECWQALWRFCEDYQECSGEAPPWELIRAKFPTFTSIEHVTVGYAVSNLRDAISSRAIRSAIAEATEVLREHDDVAAAYGVLENLPRPAAKTRTMLDGFDPSIGAQGFDLHKLPVPWTTLGRAAGGIALGEMWLLSARPGQGKSWNLAWWLRKILTDPAGYSVTLITIEMPVPRWMARLYQALAAGNKALQADLCSDNEHDRKEAIERLQDMIPGRIRATDASHGAVTSATVRSALEQGDDLTVVDHIGIMKDTKGRRAIEDWRVMAQISNDLHEDVVAAQGRLLAAAQLGRGAESSSGRAPKASDLDQSKMLEEDADSIITMKRLSDHVMTYSAEKMREGPGPRWWAHYRPAVPDLSEINYERAQEIIARDDAFHETI